MTDASLEDLVREFLKILNRKEVSLSGREFQPNHIDSCRVLDYERLSFLLTEMERKVDVKT